MTKSIWDDAKPNDLAICKDRASARIKSISFGKTKSVNYPWLIEFETSERKMAYSHEGKPARIQFQEIVFVKRKTNFERIRGHIFRLLLTLPAFLISPIFFVLACINKIKSHFFDSKYRKKRERILNLWRKTMSTKIKIWRSRVCIEIILNGWDCELPVDDSEGRLRANKLWIRESKRLSEIFGTQQNNKTSAQTIFQRTKDELLYSTKINNESQDPWIYADSHFWVLRTLLPLNGQLEKFLKDEKNTALGWFTDQEIQEARDAIVERIKENIKQLNAP